MVYIKKFKIKNPQPKIRNNSGSALLLAVLILSSMMGATLVASSIIDSGIKMGKTQFDSTKAYFAAEAGAERLLWNTRNASPLFSPETDTNCTDSAFIDFNFSTCHVLPNNFSLSNGSSYDAQLVSNIASVLVFKFYGKFGNVGRNVEISYYY